MQTLQIHHKTLLVCDAVKESFPHGGRHMYSCPREPVTVTPHPAKELYRYDEVKDSEVEIILD